MQSLTIGPAILLLATATLSCAQTSLAPTIYSENFNNIGTLTQLLDRGWTNSLWYEPPAPSNLFSFTDDALILSTGTQRSATSIASADHHGHGRLFQFGYIEITAKWESNADNWPAIWLLSSEHVRDKDSGEWCEIDIFEYIRSGFFTGTAHTFNRNHHTQNTNNEFPLPHNFDPTNWNRYAVIWTFNTITWLLNDKVLMSTPTPAPCKTQRLLLILTAQTRDIGNPEQIALRSLFYQSSQLDFPH